MTRLLLKTRYRFALLFFLFSLGISLVTRLALLSTHHGWTKPWAATALAVGEVYDLLAALWLTLPLFLFLTVLPERWFQTRWLRAALWFYSAAAVFALLFVSVIEGFFFAEFDGRFNFVAVDYLMFPTEVVTNIWESYPTGWIVAGLAVLSAGAVFLMRHQIRRAWDEPAHPLRRAQLTALYAGVLAAATWTVSPSLAQVSQDRALNEIASNGYYTFWMALLGSDAPYEGIYATRPMVTVTERLHRLLDEPAAVPASFVPAADPRPRSGAADERGHRPRGEPGLGVHRRPPPPAAEPDTAIRRPLPGRDALHPRLLHRQPHHPCH